MGCSQGSLGVITNDDINPPLITSIPNFRTKTNLFPEGEIYYLRNTEALKQGAKNENKHFLSYDELKIELTITYKFKDDSLREKFIGNTVKFYHSDLSKDDQFSYIGSTEAYTGVGYSYKKKFTMTYCFQKVQDIKCEIWLRNNIQVVNTTLGEIIGSRDTMVELPFFYEGRTDLTSVVISGFVLKDVNKNSFVTLNLYTEFPKLPFSDYFVVVSNWNNGSAPTKVWKSNEHTGKKFNFMASMVTLQDLCLGNPDQTISMEFYGIYSGKVGQVDITLNELNKAMSDNAIVDIKNDNGDITGFFQVEYSVEKISRFIDLIENGLQISLTVAIDYTSSNKQPSDPSSLHYQDLENGTPNQYEQAIRSCGSIIAHYDFDKKFPVLGFGGILPSTGETSHCFNVNLQSRPLVDGIDNVVKVYRESLSKIKLDGPTYFAPLIKNTIQLIKENESTTSIYHILLIITDGTIHDFDETKSTIIKSSYLPFSIVIIGVGDEDFSAMIELDGDKTELVDKNGNKAERDIVQFVKYMDYMNDPVRLAEEVLMEIPSQIEQYYRVYKRFVGIKESQVEMNEKEKENVYSEITGEATTIEKGEN